MELEGHWPALQSGDILVDNKMDYKDELHSKVLEAVVMKVMGG